MDTEILIIGAGPTGLMLANQLARRGVRATLIDRHSGPAQQTRAYSPSVVSLARRLRRGRSGSARLSVYDETNRRRGA